MCRLNELSHVVVYGVQGIPGKTGSPGLIGKPGPPGVPVCTHLTLPNLYLTHLD